MDKAKRAIACGSPRDRRMVLVENLDTGRILTYNSEKKATSVFTVSGFWDETYEKLGKNRYDHEDEEPTYLNKTYGKLDKGHWRGWSNPDYPEMCIPVKATITVEIE